MTISPEQIVLRRPEPEDAEQLYVYRNDRKIADLLGGFSIGYTKQDILDWVEFHRTCKDEAVYVIAECGANRCLGHVGLYNIDHRIRAAEFAVSIGDESAWGCGIGAHVTQTMLTYGFGELNLHRICLSVVSTNLRAMRLYERLGFVKEGELRDAQFRDHQYINVVVMSILEDQWRRPA